MDEIVRITKYSPEDAQRYAELIVDAFISEPGAYPGPFTRNELIRYFGCIVELGMRAKGFYILKNDEQEKGFMIYWTKKKAASWLLKTYESLKIMALIPGTKISRFVEPMNAWVDYEETYKHEKDYVDVFLVCVAKQFQHTGVFRKLLNEPMELAREKKLLCILETDSDLKMAKYTAVGLKAVKHAVLSNGVSKYIMVYDGR